VLSRRPVRAWRVGPLGRPVPDGLEARAYEPRSLLHVELEGGVHVLNTHLDHQAEPLFRHAQLVQLLAYAAEAIPRGARTVLGGDLNARPDAPEVRALAIAFTDAWAACGEGDGYTFRTDRPDRRIDYVWLAGLGCSAARVLDRPLSDHLPVIVDVRLPR
jgi:endonuclease/exonuclease/phosphatase family metal-dependent hydrolase